LGHDGGSGVIDYFLADVVTANDYYPFGMGMPGRKWDNGSNYQYGFGGKRKDNEMYGEGNAYDFGERIYDPRLVKWLSVDPLQKKFPDLTPYNYCYNNPIRFFDPDGRLGIRVEAKYNEQTGKYTILKITIDDDLRAVPPIPGVGNIGMDYHDYIDVTVFDEKGNIDYTRSMSQTTFRTNNIILGKWWAKSKVNDGIYEDYGGIMWTSEDQTSGSEETRKGRPSFMDNIDGLMAMVNGGNKLAGHQFEKKDLLELLDKFAELIQETSESAPADNIDKVDPKQASLFKQLEAILAKYSDTPTTPSENSSVIEPGKRKHVYSNYKKGTILYTNTGNVRVDSDSTGTCCQDDKKATDTVPNLKKKKTN
jgi:RHS repeat-associated protein